MQLTIGDAQVPPLELLTLTEDVVLVVVLLLLLVLPPAEDVVPVDVVPPAAPPAPVVTSNGAPRQPTAGSTTGAASARPSHKPSFNCTSTSRRASPLRRSPKSTLYTQSPPPGSRRGALPERHPGLLVAVRRSRRDGRVSYLVTRGPTAT